MDDELVIKLCLVGGTGIGKMLHPLGERYYRAILGHKGITDIVGKPHLISLPYAGLLDPRIRHAGVNHVRQHKLGKNVKLILVGHSQGALEVALHGLRHPEDVLAVICLSGPLDGAPLATRFNWLPWLPSGVRQMAKGSEQLREIEQRASCFGFLHRNGDMTKLPEFHLIAASDDGLVPVGSAWHFADEYPRHLVYRYLLARGEGIVPSDVKVLQTNAIFANHIGEVLAPETVDVIVDILERNVPIETTAVELEVGSA